METSTAATADSLHLIVCSHGFMGSPTHLDYIVQRLQNSQQKSIIVYNSKINNFNNTLDGVDLCGTRLANEIEKVVKQSPSKVATFSIIGYSLGGLLARYAIGLLYQRGFFEDIQPLNFVTFATPHLGVRRPAEYLFSRIFQYVTVRVGSFTGVQLLLEDRDVSPYPLLQRMTFPESHFMKALALFKRRALYANVLTDRTVSYCTASISEHNPYRKLNFDWRMDEKYPHVIRRQEQLPYQYENADSEQSPLLSSPKGNRSQSTTADLFWNLLKLLLLVIPLSPILLIVLLGFACLGLYSRFKVRSSRALSINLADESSKKPSESSVAAKFDEAAVRREMITSLNTLEWARVDVHIEAFNAHGPIINRSPKHPLYWRLTTTDVADHFIDHFLYL